jgi:hypothetical protein
LFVNTIAISVSKESNLQLSSLFLIASAQGSENGNGSDIIPCNSYWIYYYGSLVVCEGGGLSAGGTPYVKGTEEGLQGCNYEIANFGGCVIGGFSFQHNCETTVGCDMRTWRDCSN